MLTPLAIGVITGGIFLALTTEVHEWDVTDAAIVGSIGLFIGAYFSASCVFIVRFFSGDLQHMPRYAKTLGWSGIILMPAAATYFFPPVTVVYDKRGFSHFISGPRVQLVS